MTAPIAQTKGTPPGPGSVPTGIRVASVICWGVGLLSAALAFVLSGRPGGTVAALAVNLVGAIAMCIAGYLIWRQRRLGAYIVILAWALPFIENMIAGKPLRAGSPLLLLAMLFSLANWKKLH